MSDWVIPGYSVRSKRGEIFTNDLVTTTEKHAIGSGNHYQITSIGSNTSCGSPVMYATRDYLGPLGHHWLSGSPTGGSVLSRYNLISDEDVSSAASVAATKAWSNTSNHNATILTDLAEMKQTLAMLRNPINSTHKLFETIHRSKKYKAYAQRKSWRIGDTQDYLQGMWLQYRYGVRPLISSVQGIIEALKKSHPKERYTVRGNYRMQATSQGSLMPYNDGTATHYYRYQYTDTVNVRAGILMEDSLDVAEALGLDASGLLGLPWELVPFSFVADWFSNFGTWITGSYLHLVKHPLSSWLTTERDRVTAFSMSGSIPNSPSTWRITRSSAEGRVSHFIDKTRSGICPSPTIAWKPQALSRVSEDARLLDSAALLLQKFNTVFK